MREFARLLASRLTGTLPSAPPRPPVRYRYHVELVRRHALDFEAEAPSIDAFRSLAKQALGAVTDWGTPVAELGEIVPLGWVEESLEAIRAWDAQYAAHFGVDGHPYCHQCGNGLTSPRDVQPDGSHCCVRCRP